MTTRRRRSSRNSAAGSFVRAGEMVTLEGQEETSRLVVIEFPNLARAKEFYHSTEYTKVRKLREGAAIGQFVVVEGYAGTAPQ